MDSPTRVLTASERAEVHLTIERALALLGEGDARIELLRADGATETLAIATAEQPKIAFLDVTIGAGAGVGLVHFLQSVVPGLVVVAIVPEGDSDVRLVEQAASLGASWVLLGELTGDDVLRAFGRVAPSLAPSVPPIASPPPLDDEAPATRRAAAISDVRTFPELDQTLALFTEQLGPGDARRAIVDDVRAAIERCVARERTERASIQDASTSAYSFAYFVDLAGREIDLARRHARRFALATVDLSAGELDARAMVELVLGAVRDTDVVARADERELLLLLPETGSKGARTLRRRILERLQQLAGAQNPPPARVGIASFPFDGEDLSRLLRIARRRAERWSPWDTPWASARALHDALSFLARPHRPGELPGGVFGPFVPLEVPLREGWALFDTVVRESTRGGEATIALHSPHDNESALGLAQGIRASTIDAMGPSSHAGSGAGALPGALPGRGERDRDVLSLVTGVSRLAEDATFAGLEVVAVLAEHACHALVGRVDDGRLIALHGHDLPIVEALIHGLEQPVLRRATISANAPSSAAPASARTSRSDPFGLRRTP